MWRIFVDIDGRANIIFDESIESSIKYRNVTISKVSLHAEAFKWLDSAYSSPTKPKSKVAIADCMAATGATREETKSALRKVEGRRTRGQSN